MTGEFQPPSVRIRWNSTSAALKSRFLKKKRQPLVIPGFHEVDICPKSKKIN
jgi:hypothetical protein